MFLYITRLVKLIPSAPKVTDVAATQPYLNQASKHRWAV